MNAQFPLHWKTSRLKFIATVQLSNVDKKSVEGESAVRLCNYVDVYKNDHITSDMEFMDATASDRQIRDFTLRAGDVLITKDSEAWNDIAVPALVASDLDGVLCGYHLAHIRPKADVMTGGFLFRAFAAEGIADQFRVAANGITRFGIGKDEITGALFPVPPLEEQQAIADFLDRMTAQIDGVIAKKQRMIDLLHEKRQALISEAVTKGLDPNVPMKDSGIEWLGWVPKHWIITKFSRTAFFQEGPGLRNWQFTDSGVRVICVTNITEGGIDFSKYSKFISEDEYAASYRHFTVSRGDLLLSSSGNSWGKIAVFDDCQPAILNTSTIRINANSNRTFRHNYLRWILQSNQTREQLSLMMTGACQPNFGPSHLSQVVVAVPPPDEQERISDYLNGTAATAFGVQQKIESQIAKLREFRQTLISAAVTGQIDVTTEDKR